MPPSVVDLENRELFLALARGQACVFKATSDVRSDLGGLKRLPGEFGVTVNVEHLVESYRPQDLHHGGG